jgi:hypothetical protein
MRKSKYGMSISYWGIINFILIYGIFLDYFWDMLCIWVINVSITCK